MISTIPALRDLHIKVTRNQPNLNRKCRSMRISSPMKIFQSNCRKNEKMDPRTRVNCHKKNLVLYGTYCTCIPYRSALYGSCTQIPYSSSLRYLQKHIVALFLCVASLALRSLLAHLVANVSSIPAFVSFPASYCRL